MNRKTTKNKTNDENNKMNKNNEELKNYKFNCLLSPIDKRDYMASSYLNLNTKLPEKFDLRDKLPAVRDQVLQGSCVAQTVCAIKEYHENVDVGFKNHMSPQFIYNLRDCYPEDGMYCRNALEILRNIGSCPEKYFPYGSSTKPDSITPELKLRAANYKIKGYTSIRTIDDLKRALMQHGPCIITFPVYNQLKMHFWMETNSGEILGYHCVTVVGWDKNGFIIRNSWGILWGNLGHTDYPYEQWGRHDECWSVVDAKSVVNQEDNKDEGFRCFGFFN